MVGAVRALALLALPPLTGRSAWFEAGLALQLLNKDSDAGRPQVVLSRREMETARHFEEAVRCARAKLYALPQ